MLRSKNNLIQRKKAEENINKIKSVNYEFHQYLDIYVEENREGVQPEVLEIFKNLSEHLININFIFTEMMKKK